MRFQQPLDPDQSREDDSPGTWRPTPELAGLKALDRAGGRQLLRSRQRLACPPFQPKRAAAPARPSTPTCQRWPPSGAGPGWHSGSALASRGPCRPRTHTHQASERAPRPWWISRQPGRRASARERPAAAVSRGLHPPSRVSALRQTCQLLKAPEIHANRGAPSRQSHSGCLCPSSRIAR